MRLFFSLLLLVLSTTLMSQNQRRIDSLLLELKKAKTDSIVVKQMSAIALAYQNIDSVKGFYYGRKALQLSKKIKWKQGIAISNYCIGVHYAENFIAEKAFYHYNQALSNTKDPLLLNNIHLAIGQVYLHQSKYTEALKAFHKSLKVCENSGNKRGIIKVSLFIGSVYSGLSNHKKAISHYNTGLKISDEINEDVYMDVLLRGIAVVYSDLGDYKKALEYFEKGYSHSLETKNMDYQASILSDIALVYLNLEDYKKSIAYSRKSLEIQNLLSADKLNIAFNYGVIGDSYLDMAQAENNNKVHLDSAVVNLNHAIQLHKEVKAQRSLLDDYTSLSLAQKLKGDYKSALESYELSVTYKDSIFNSDNKETIKNLEDKREIELRDKKLKINQLELDASEKQRWYFILGLILLGIIGGLLFYQNRNRKKTNKKLHSLNTNLDTKNHELDQANKTNARFFGILNHDLRSPVYNLIHFLHLQKESPELLDDSTKEAIEKQTLQSAENLLTSMEDILQWSKSQMENFKPQPQKLQVVTLFDDTGKHFSSVGNVEFRFENPDDLVLFTDGNYLKTIVRNLTGNAVKALEDVQNPVVAWKAFQDNGIPFLSITDNGKGASDEQFRALYDEKEVTGIKTGLGLHLIRDLAKAIDCEISVDSQLNAGTTIQLKFVTSDN